MKVYGLANLKDNLILDKDLKRVLGWRSDDLLQAEFDTEKQTLKIHNLSLQALNQDKKIVNFSAVKLFEVKDYWNSLTGNDETLTINLEKLLRPIIITSHADELKKEIKKAVIENPKRLVGMTLSAFIKSKKIHERWFKK